VSEQPDFQHADFFAARLQGLDRLFRGTHAGAHQDHDALGVGSAIIVEQVVGAADPLREPIHHVLHDGRTGQVERIDRLARLEKYVWILCRSAQDRTIRRHCPLAVRPHQFVVDQRAQVVVAQLVDQVDFVRGAEPVKEMQERHARFQRRGLGDQREIVRFLNGVGGEQRESGLPGRHHVAVVAEDRKRVRRERARRHMDDRRSQFAGDLVHVGNHQQ
jgi:hypothetical protein